MIGFTVTVNVNVVTHCPGAPVKTYFPLAVLLTTDGLHVPEIPLLDIAGNTGAPAPAQIDKLGPKLNAGIAFGVTLKVNVVTPGVTHWPAAGVNVYIPPLWLSTTDGLHVPDIPFADVVANTGTAPPAQIVALVPKLNVGVTFGLTVTAKVVDVAQSPASGVNM